MTRVTYHPFYNNTDTGRRYSMKLAPFRPALTLQREIDRLFNEWPAQQTAAWHPTVDVHEDDNAFIINAELPGITAEDVKISLEDNVLTISGDKKQEKDEKDQHYFRTERNYGSFKRSFKLPSIIDPDKITATYKDGVLAITLTKAEEAKPREIPVVTG